MKRSRDSGTRTDPPQQPSGARDAGGATTHGSIFGGRSLQSMLLRSLARWARTVEGFAYRRLRDLDLAAPEPRGGRGRPLRTRRANSDEKTLHV